MSCKVLYSSLEILPCEEQLTRSTVVCASDHEGSLAVFIKTKNSVAVDVHVKRQWVLLIAESIVAVPLDFVHCDFKLTKHRAGFVLSLNHTVIHDATVCKCRTGHVLLGKIDGPVLSSLAEKLIRSLFVLSISSHLTVQSYHQIVKGQGVVLVHQPLVSHPSDSLVLKCFILVIVHFARECLSFITLEIPCLSRD